MSWRTKSKVTTCSKFDAEVRARLDIPREESEESSGNEEADSKEGMRRCHPKSVKIPKVHDVMKEEEESGVEESGSRGLLNNNVYFKDVKPVPGADGEDSGNNINSPSTSSALQDRDKFVFDKTNGKSPCEEDNYGTESKAAKTVATIPRNNKLDLIQSLADGAGENVLSFEFLLGRHDTAPFHTASNADLKLLRRRRRIWKKRRRLAVLKRRLDKQNSRRQNRNPGHSNVVSGSTSQPPPSKESPSSLTRVSMRLHSVKMRGLKGLLCAEKLNTSAIQLQLTAQSQTEVKKGKTGGEDDCVSGSRPKRARRE